MITEQELDELYAKVRESREMCNAKIGYVYIREIVQGVLKAFQPYDKLKDPISYLIIKMNGKTMTRWDLTEDGKGAETSYLTLNEQEKEYLEKLLQKYCNIEKITEVEWKLKLKN